MSEVFLLRIHQRWSSSAFDLRDILNVLSSDRVRALTWGVDITELIVETDAPVNVKKFYSQYYGPAVLSGEQFLHLAEETYQTIDSLFVGFSTREATTDFIFPEWYNVYIPSSAAQIVIEARDGSFFDIYLRSQSEVDRVRSFFSEATVEDVGGFRIKPSESSILSKEGSSPHEA